MDRRPSLPQEKEKGAGPPPAPVAPSPSPAGSGALHPQDAQSSRPELQTQDWVNEPQPSHPSRHWSISIEERRRRASMSGWERRPTEGAPAPPKDITQIVAELVSEDVDRDVLLPHPLKSASSTHVVPNLLAQSAALWQNAAVEDQTSKPPQS